MAREGFTVVVEGEREFVAALKKVNADLPKHMAKAFKVIAVHVVGVARSKMEFGSGPAAMSLKPHGTTREASITFPAGGPESRNDKAGMYPWLDFGGGKTGVRGVTSSTGASHERSSSQQFKRGVPKGGRYLYPAIAESTGFIADSVDKEMKYLIVAAGFDTEGKLDAP